MRAVMHLDHDAAAQFDALTVNGFRQRSKRGDLLSYGNSFSISRLDKLLMPQRIRQAGLRN
jgi:hypothetical protein